MNEIAGKRFQSKNYNIFKTYVWVRLTAFHSSPLYNFEHASVSKISPDEFVHVTSFLLNLKNETIRDKVEEKKGKESKNKPQWDSRYQKKNDSIIFDTHSSSTSPAGIRTRQTFDETISIYPCGQKGKKYKPGREEQGDEDIKL